MNKHHHYYQLFLFLSFVLLSNGKEESHIRSLKNNKPKDTPSPTTPSPTAIPTVSTPPPVREPTQNPPPSPPSGGTTIYTTLKLSPFYLTLTSESTASFNLDTTTLVKETKQYFDNYISSKVPAYSPEVSQLDITIMEESTRLRKRRKLSNEDNKDGSNNNNPYKIVEIQSEAAFSNTEVPTADEMKEMQLQIFDEEYINKIESIDATYSFGSFKATASATYPQLNENDVGDVGDKSEDETTIGGNMNYIDDEKGGTNIGGVAGGVSAALVLLCVASLLYVKSKRAKEQDGQQRKQKTLFPISQSEDDLKDDWMKGGTFSSTQDEDQEGRRKEKYSSRHTTYVLAEGNVNSNAHIVSNDDGSGFEAIYKIQGELSPNLTNLYSSPSRMAKSCSMSVRSKAMQSIDNYSLDGSYALDTTNNTGDAMLGRVLALNSYQCETLESPEVTSQCNESASVDISMYSYSHEAQGDFETIWNKKSAVKATKTGSPSQRQTIKDLRAAAALNHSSPQKDVIVFDGSPTISPAIDEKIMNKREEVHTQSQTLPNALRTTSLMDECLSSQGSVASNMDNSQDSFDSGLDNSITEELEDDSVQVSHDTKQNQIKPNSAMLNDTNGVNKAEKQNGILQNVETEKLNENYQVIETEKMIGNYQVIETEKLSDSKMIPKSFQRSSSNLPKTKHRHKITITTAPPPQPPQTPEKFPIQSAKNIKRRTKYNVNRRSDNYDSDSSESSEQDESSYSSNEESVDEPKPIPSKHINEPKSLQSKHDNSKTGKRKDGTIRPALIDHNYIPSARPNNVPRHQYGVLKNRPDMASCNLENARNSRKNRLAKSMDIPNKDRGDTTPNSKAEIASNLRRSRLQKQKIIPRSESTILRDSRLKY